MSLARSQNMTYAAAGRQPRSFEKMHVHSHVHVPNAEACEDTAARPVFTAPPQAQRKRREVTLSMGTTLVLTVLAVAAVAVCYISARVDYTHYNKQRQELLNEMQAAQREIIVLKEEVAKARESSNICYQAAQRLGMVSSQGMEMIEIYAPDTRPDNADFSLSAGSAVASLYP